MNRKNTARKIAGIKIQVLFDASATKTGMIPSKLLAAHTRKYALPRFVINLSAIQPPPNVPAAPAASVDLAKGRELFANYGCSGCHILADGGGSGAIGPSLDNNPRLTHDFVFGAISEGRGSMPAFRDQMTADEIATLAAYVVQVARK